MRPGPGWKRTDIENRFHVEFAFLVDLDNDGKALEVLPQFGDAAAPLAWCQLRDGRWQAHAVSSRSYGLGIVELGGGFLQIPATRSPAGATASASAPET